MTEYQNQAGFLMAKIHQISGRIFARLLREHDIYLNPSQGRILFVLWQNDGIPIQELVRQTSLQKSSLTSMLDRLEEAGYIKRVPSKADRRKIHIWRTQKDIELQNDYEAVSKKMESIYYRHFPKNEIQRFDNDLKKILDNLESFERNADHRKEIER